MKMRHKMIYSRIIALCAAALFVPLSAQAQVFEGSDDWDDQKMIVAAKWSQLYYELNIGKRLNNKSKYESYANFLYIAIGAGFPTTKNAWRKFLPGQQIPSNEAEAQIYSSMTTDDVYGGKIGLGWVHYFNHSIGLYTQVSWGVLADFGTPSDDDTSTSSDSKKTFIYNTAPVELGVCLNCWKHLHLQGGVTYMWKEIPLLTVGVGATF